MTDFDNRYLACGKAFGGLLPGLSEARKLTERLTHDFPDRAEAWFLRNLATCMSNPKNRTSSTDQLIHAASQHCGASLTEEIIADMRRDQAISLITFAKSREDLDSAEEMIGTLANGPHAGDTNRLICLHGIRGRLAFARGGYNEARAYHIEANGQWENLGDAADQNWVGLNLVYGLRATVKAHRRDSTIAEQEFYNILQSHPGEKRKAKLLMMPGGTFIFRQLMLHR